MEFNKNQIEKANINSNFNFPKLVKELKEIGVTNFKTFVSNGLTEYFDQNNEQISFDGINNFSISDQLNVAKFEERLKLHQQGGTDFLTFCKDCAENGVDNWVVDLQKMTCTYFDKKGNSVLVEKIPSI
ncbi:Uncharacterized conserved protein YbcV, DUF1398 family [Halpernia humi]|uniref:Uncharacterized conserved protein YbcV, DUF1398 family n=1 Tax=Halpernia humi TaxID=493375 RepID=A0A1H6B8Z7_9FLAO|nr:DUF1398 family protein [Halpernia humi]SEG57323.1 Uncharacterized conserved protein YbcV, DUF1398 family [Halpernia humi]